MARAHFVRHVVGILSFLLVASCGPADELSETTSSKTVETTEQSLNRPPACGMDEHYVESYEFSNNCDCNVLDANGNPLIRGRRTLRYLSCCSDTMVCHSTTFMGYTCTEDWSC